MGHNVEFRPLDADSSPGLREVATLAYRALEDAYRVISTIDGDDTHEQWELDLLLRRVKDVASSLFVVLRYPKVGAVEVDPGARLKNESPNAALTGAGTALREDEPSYGGKSLAEVRKSPQLCTGDTVADLVRRIDMLEVWLADSHSVCALIRKDSARYKFCRSRWVRFDGEILLNDELDAAIDAAMMPNVEHQGLPKAVPLDGSVMPQETE